MTDTAPIQSYLALLDTQAASLFSELPLNLEDDLWRRPSHDQWSVGENLSHVAVVHRFFRRLNRLLWPLTSLIARARTGRRFQPEIDDVYARPDFPHSVGRLWPPEYSPERPVPLDHLVKAISHEHRMVRGFYEERGLALLRQALLYIPAIGWINYIQSLRISVFHDAHHFAEIRKAISAARDGNFPGA